MYGTTFKFGKELYDLCRNNDFEYHGVLIQPPFETVLANMTQRNGGKEINFESLTTKVTVAK